MHKSTKNHRTRLSQWKEKLFNVKETALNCVYILNGGGTHGSITKTTHKVIETGVEVNTYFHKRSLFTNYERAMDQQKEMHGQTYAVKQKDPMAVEVSLNETPKNLKVKKQRWRTNFKHKTNIFADSKRPLKT